MRPHIARVAHRYALSGWCRNDSTGVTIEWQGSPTAVEEAADTLLRTLPTLAQVTHHTISPLPVCADETGFTIDRSHQAPHASDEHTLLIPPDIAPCPDCLAEFFDPTNRRYHYPFINCTNCGPRLSIITALPYDRTTTTMASFPLCPDCAAEYVDPLDRRYHAEPIACPTCGPHLWAEAPGVTIEDTEEVVARVHAWWDTGLVVAVKGIGGFHLTCDATSATAIRRLRQRKHRPAQPLAVMVPDEDTLQRLVQLTDPSDRELVRSPARPIVIAPSRGVLPEEIAPGLNTVGVMLPYSPLHYLLVDRPIVATSGNVAGEPICIDNAEARTRLRDVADAFVLHNRGIFIPVDDSVMFPGGTPVRRSRGYAPAPLTLATPTPAPILAVGGELKNTFCFLEGRQAHISAHVGNMGSLAAQEVFERGVAELLSLRDATPRIVACDMHPWYATTSWAERYANRTDAQLVEVQHHHAHAAALLAEHEVRADAAVATLDGTGYGTDGTIWGGEILGFDEGLATFERCWHLPTFPLAGGDKAARQPWRCAVGLSAQLGIEWQPPAGVQAEEFELVTAQAVARTHTMETSSAGRYFDACAALLGVAPTQVSYEGQAACELEALARRGEDHGITDMLTVLTDSTLPACDRARAFHRALAHLIAAELLQTGKETLGVSGGCALNRLLVSYLHEELARAGHTLLTHRLVPPNDGGVCFGQAVVAAEQLTAGR